MRACVCVCSPLLSVLSPQCFSCATCRVRLLPGDRFHLVNGTILCEQERPGSALLGSPRPPLQGGSVSERKVRTRLRLFFWHVGGW